MLNHGETCCPDCGSEKAVSKSVAWDAAAKIPPRAAEELGRLQQLEIAARALIAASPHPGNEKTVVVSVPLELLKRLAIAAELELS